jgi:hypothetical protein
MIILNNMYTGRYITQQGKLGHEIINLFKADDGKFYIWLNSMGVCTQSKADGCTILMVRSVNASLYKVLAKAEDCQFCDGAKSYRARKNIEKEKEKAEKRYKAQKNLVKEGATYNEKIQWMISSRIMTCLPLLSREMYMKPTAMFILQLSRREKI